MGGCVGGWREDALEVRLMVFLETQIYLGVLSASARRHRRWMLEPWLGWMKVDAEESRPFTEL